MRDQISIVTVGLGLVVIAIIFLLLGNVFHACAYAGDYDCVLSDSYPDCAKTAPTIQVNVTTAVPAISMEQLTNPDGPYVIAFSKGGERPTYDTVKNLERDLVVGGQMYNMGDQSDNYAKSHNIPLVFSTIHEAAYAKEHSLTLHCCGDKAIEALLAPKTDNTSPIAPILFVVLIAGAIIGALLMFAR